MNTESDVNTVVDTGEHTHMHTHAPSQDARSPQTQHLPLPQPVHASPRRAWVRVLSIGSLTLVLALLLAAEYRLKGSPLPPRLVLEELFLTMLDGKRRGGGQNR